MSWRGVIEEYREFMSVTDETPVVTLLEGDTPLVPAPALAERVGAAQVHLKMEGCHPSGSFKDRGMTLAVTKAVEEGSGAIICASTGNTSASAAAYAARAGIHCVVVLPRGAVALGKLSQALIHGALVVSIDGNFDNALDMVKDAVQRYRVTLVNSINPYRLEGQKSGAYEICDALGRAPDFHAIPVGNAGNITAYWQGYKDYKHCGRSGSLPRMIGFQAIGSAPIVEGRIVENPQTIATAIKIGNPANWEKAVNAYTESGGLIDVVTDEEILEAYRFIAAKVGLFVEPASAAGVAGILKKAGTGLFKPTDVIACTLTGHGLKDPDRAIASVGGAVEIPFDSMALDEVLKGKIEKK